MLSKQHSHARRDVGPWVIVPVWVLRRPMHLRALRLYCELAAFADSDNGSCWPSHATLAERMGCSQDTVHRAQVELEAHGCILVEERRTPQGDRASNLYTVMTLDPLSTGTRTGAPTYPQPCGEGPRTGAGVTRTRELDKAQPVEKRLGAQNYRDAECPDCGGSGVTGFGSVCACFLEATAP